jgi:MYXO-CTERM domain-containing protein
VEFPAPSVSDAGTVSPTVTSTWPSGSYFPVGTTPVTFTATDAAGLSAQCTMNVTVEETAGGCGCGAGSASSTGLLGLLALALGRSGRRRRRAAAP